MKKTLFGTMIIATLISSCNTAYKSGQTPDDLYFSPEKEISANAVRKQTQEGDQYQQYVSTMDDRYLRMKVANRNQWNAVDDFSYWNDMRFNFTPINSFNGFNNFYGNGFHGNMFNNFNNPWNIGWNNGWNNGFNSWGNNGWNNGFNSWGNNGWNTWGNMGWGNGLGWNNPMFTLINYTNPKAIPITSNSGSNLNAYRNRTYNNSNDGNKYNNWSTPSTSSNNKSFGSLIRSVISTPSNGSGGSNSYDRPARSFGSSTPTSSSAGGRSGGFSSSGSSTNSGRAGRGQ